MTLAHRQGDKWLILSCCWGLPSPSVAVSLLVLTGLRSLSRNWLAVVGPEAGAPASSPGWQGATAGKLSHASSRLLDLDPSYLLTLA